MKIKAKTDVITNSSSECYIIKSDVYPFNLNYIRDLNFYEIDMDEIILILEKVLHKKLIDNPFPVRYNYDNKPFSGIIKPWGIRYDISPGETEEIWKNFVDKNLESFKELEKYSFLEGPEDNTMDYKEYVELCSEMRSMSIIVIPRGSSIWEQYSNLYE